MQRIPSTRSSAATKCISEVPGLAKHTLTPPPTKVRTRLSAPFMISSDSRCAVLAAPACRHPARAARPPPGLCPYRPHATSCTFMVDADQSRTLNMHEISYDYLRYRTRTLSPLAPLLRRRGRDPHPG